MMIREILREVSKNLKTSYDHVVNLVKIAPVKELKYSTYVEYCGDLSDLDTEVATIIGVENVYYSETDKEYYIDLKPINENDKLIGQIEYIVQEDNYYGENLLKELKLFLLVPDD
jgi:hypothetical protein